MSVLDQFRHGLAVLGSIPSRDGSRLVSQYLSMQKGLMDLTETTTDARDKLALDGMWQQMRVCLGSLPLQLPPGLEYVNLSIYHIGPLSSRVNLHGGDALVHGGIAAYGKELTFGGGGMYALDKPGSDTNHPFWKFDRLGITALPEWKFRDMVKYWEKTTPSYCLTRFNCLHFCSKTSLAMGTGPIPVEYNVVANRLAQLTPSSMPPLNLNLPDLWNPSSSSEEEEMAPHEYFQKAPAQPAQAKRKVESSQNMLVDGEPSPKKCKRYGLVGRRWNWSLTSQEQLVLEQLCAEIPCRRIWDGKGLPPKHLIPAPITIKEVGHRAGVGKDRARKLLDMASRKN